MVASDTSTLAVYDAKAKEFGAEWHDQPPPSDLHAAVRQFFRPGLTADIGCGSGRDTAWLTANGYPCVGYDASAGLLAEARRRYPSGTFLQSALPELSSIADESYDNVLCETVIMHLPRVAIAPSVRRLHAILRPLGTVYLTWRVTTGADRRDDNGRLYTAFDVDAVRTALERANILLDEERVSASSAKIIHRIVARKF